MPTDKTNPDTPQNRRLIHGRRQGHRLHPAQARRVAEILPEFEPELAAGNLAQWFGARVPETGFDTFALEIGFGGGEHLVHQAGQNPGVGIIGCEPYINGVAMLLGKIRRAGVDNLAVHPGDARDMFDVLRPGSVEKAFLLYPDPWPKARHHRRRFVTPEHLEPLAHVLGPGAEFRVATDIPDYVRQTLEEVPRHGFEWRAEGPEDWRTPWDDWISTRYEQKALREGRVPHYLTFRKR